MGSSPFGLYCGQLSHRRFVPAKNFFVYRLFMLYFDLDLLRHSYLAYCWPLFSYWGPALVWFRCQDYLNSQSLEELSNILVFLLTLNIPWLESHIEVLVPKETQYDASLSSSLIVMKSHPKAFHVSPFLPMENIEYNWCFSNPIENLRVTTLLKHQQHNILFASLDLERHAWSLLSLLIFLFRYPFMTWKVIFAIHWEAYQLWKRKFPFYSHPNNSQNVWSRMIDFFSSWFY
ncbi:hypothetical protein Gasu2_45490 [Galdieria sulphuraria]|nr:hypothetical protein Gasu2_45490 [Galdieria sulphuraria]